MEINSGRQSPRRKSDWITELRSDLAALPDIEFLAMPLECIESVDMHVMWLLLKLLKNYENLDVMSRIIFTVLC